MFTTKLSRMSNGIQRNEREAIEDTCAEALNVWAPNRVLQRRPAFKPVAAGAPYYLPHGSCIVVHEYPADVATVYESRVFSIPYNQIGINGGLWFGCIYQFDGILWGKGASGPFVNGMTHLRVRYLDSLGLLRTFYDPIDETINVPGPSQLFNVPLQKDGHIHWSKSQATNWTKRALPLSTGLAETYYWVSLDFSDYADYPDNTVAAENYPGTSGDFFVGADGLRAFICNPITALTHVLNKRGKQFFVVGADFQSQRSHCFGANVSVIKSFGEMGESAYTIDDQGAGMMGEPVVPQASGGTAVAPNAVANTIGKLDRTYDWISNLALPTGRDQGQFNGGPIVTGLTTGAGLAASITPIADWNPGDSTDCEGMVLKCITNSGANGVPVGEERIIWRSQAGLIEVYDDWSAVTNGTETFEVRFPSAEVFSQQPFTFRRPYLLASSTAHNATLVTTRPYQPALSGDEANSFVNFQIGKPFVWSIRAGRRWCFAYDPVRQKLMATNGRSGLLEYDGVGWRVTEALFNPTDGAIGAVLVQSYRGLQPGIQDGSPELQGTQLHETPPSGEFIVAFAGRLFVSDGDVIYYSAPGPFIQLWPKTFRAEIRGQESLKISGLASCGSRILAFTPNGIWAAEPPRGSAEALVFQQISRGRGFCSHHAVVEHEIDGVTVLFGISSDGIIATDGRSVWSIINTWEDILDVKVNKSRLHMACGSKLHVEDSIVFSLASYGKDDNDKIIIFNPKAKTFWVWSAPYGGVTGICHAYSLDGGGQTYFGHADGTISTLAFGAVYDRGAAIEGYALSQPIGVDGKIQGAEGVSLEMLVMGRTPTIDVRFFSDQSSQPTHGDNQVASFQATVPPPNLQACLDYAVLDTSTIGNRRYQRVRFSAPAGVNGDTLQVEIRSTNPFEYRGGLLHASIKGDVK